MAQLIQVVVATPAHAGLVGALTYQSEQPLAAGTLVRVPFGAREVLGVVWDAAANDLATPAGLTPRPIAGPLDGLAPLNASWRRLIDFTAGYYQRSAGEVALAALPPQLRELSSVQLARRLRRPAGTATQRPAPDGGPPALSAQQQAALTAFGADSRPALLFGATGSGKTEVYLHAAADVLARDADAQVLVMVPEINLTPQLEARFQARFAHLGEGQVVSLHSGLTPAQRLKSWLAAHTGQARLLLGTRLAVLASLPRLRLVIVDEEHDPSYKQQEGARYSARDLAVYRARLETGMALAAQTPPCGILDQARDNEENRETTATSTGIRLFEQGPQDRLGRTAGAGLRDAVLLSAVQACTAGSEPRPTVPSGGSAVREATSVGAHVLLGSATPSLESWQATISGKYQRLEMSERIGVAPTLPTACGSLPPEGAVGRSSEPAVQAWTALRRTASRSPAPAVWQSQSRGPGLHGAPADSATAPTTPSNGEPGQLPTVKRVDMNHQPKRSIIAPPLLEAIALRVARGEQSLIFLNRRGYAPVLSCHDCGWKSQCPHCSAYRVFHKADRTLRCHHCGFTSRVPRACPDCGNLDIAPVGRGTEQLEEHIGELLADVKRPGGGPVRVARIDADTTRAKGALESQLASVHAGEVDVLVGTQMIAKGHDFRRITLVAAINPDTALFSSDFRAPERLFSLLMQAAGRAGRDARHSAASEMWVQTFHPAHPLFAALARHDYPLFAAQQLADRQAAGLAPFGYSALVRAEARTQAVAQGFLNAAAEAARTAQLPGESQVTPYPAVPMTIQRVADIERAQMLVESPSRRALQAFLAAWQPLLFDTRKQAEFKSLVRWAIDVDPIAI